MQFLKTVFWVLIAVVAVLFATHNWTDVRVSLWSDLVWDTKLPFLLLIAFLIGFVPTWSLLRTRLWSHKRRIEAMERNRLTTLRPERADEPEASI
jgi:lipopolysaccharide assembly protein A